jgi:short-subunit dehydrogenase
MNDAGKLEGAGRTVLVTGASAGIGKALTRVFAAHGFDAVLVARRKDRLQALADELTRDHGVAARVVTADLADPASPDRVKQRLDADGVRVDALVNNAGYAVRPDFCATEWRIHAAFIQVLATSVAHLCHLFGAGMRERGYGRILNIASLAAFAPDSAGSLYTPLKSFVVHLSRALDLELRPHGVHVTALCPGFTHTEFHESVGVQAEVDRLPRFLWMDADTVARQGYAAVMAGQPVLINGRVNQAIAGVCKLLPDSLQHEVSRLQGRPF